MATDISKKYVKKNQREHVLDRSGMYIGSIESDVYDMWLVNADGSKMEKRSVTYIPGLFKIFDEIIANASDHYYRLKATTAANPVKEIRVDIDKETGVISVMNTGDGIDIVVHPEHEIYIPQLIFGNLLTSTNYNDDESREVIGVMGIGSKATNIFSEWFEIETVDAVRKQLYKQKFESNMSVIGKPKITKCTKKPYTTITFKPDYKRFGGGMAGLTDDMYEVMRKRVYDLCAVTDKDINIFFNGAKIEFKSFEKYVDLYLGSKSEHTRVYEAVNERWEVIASYNAFNGFEQISFVNGLLTIRGGKHVDYIVNQIVKKMTEMLGKKSKSVIKPQAIKDNMIIFIKCTIINPSFDSQSKETMTTPVSKFGSKAEISDKFIEKLYKSGLADKVLEICAIHEEKALKKTDGKKRDVIRGLPQLEDANWAGTLKAKECMLLLTEGNSAASMAISGLSVVGRDRYGVFPLRGKVMNVKDTNAQKIADNQEIANIKKIIGLETGKKYTNINELRYGGIIMFTDSDTDGSHIKGLIMNLFHSLWPSLLKDFKFMHCMLTPIIKTKRRDEVVSFYTMTEFENWKREHETEMRQWEVKYYKGLGTSTEDEAKEYFRNMKLVSYKYTDLTDTNLDLAFNKKRADDRKTWLGDYDRDNILNANSTEVTFEDFVNKELIHFSNYDIARSIPSMVDGLKISQRKILFACFKRGLTDKEIRVAQLAAYVSENAAYHHGETSLQGAIINMAQDFVGSNNINLLQPNGQFGSRLHGGKDAAQPRYIHTLLTNICLSIFKKVDNAVLRYMEDDGLSIEPDYYVPVIPMILVNGGLGIGTGFSTSIPSYNPLDIVSLLKRMLAGEHVSSDDDDLVPWFRGFTGDIRKVNEKYYSIGKFAKVSATKVEITELPIGYSTFDFKSDLEDQLDKMPEFKKYENQSAGNKVHFTLHFSGSPVIDKLLEIESNGFTRFENVFKLITSKPLSTTNMYAFNSKGVITKYDTCFDIVNEFYDVRLEYYRKRKTYILQNLEHQVAIMENKIRFIKEVVAEVVKIHKMKKSDVEAHLVNESYLAVDGSYDYITRLSLFSLTVDRVAELESEIAAAHGEIDALKDKKEEKIWLEELEEFEIAYDKFIKAGASPAPRKKSAAAAK